MWPRTIRTVIVVLLTIVVMRPVVAQIPRAWLGAIAIALIGVLHAMSIVEVATFAYRKCRN